jgi:hypothetical protein
MKLVDKKDKKELEVYIETLKQCDFCSKENVKGFAVIENYQQLCFDCVEELYKIMSSKKEL